MKLKNSLFLFIILGLILIVICFYFKLSFTGKATDPICSGTPICNYPNSFSCNAHCACNWVDTCIVVGCSECDSESDCGDSSCTWTPAEPFCGDEIIDAGEDCDGSNLGGETCESQGFDSGDLACSSCEFNTSDCVVPESCGDGTCQATETCNSCPGDCGQCPTTTIISGGGGTIGIVEIVPRVPLEGDIIRHGILELKTQIYYAGKPISSNLVKVMANSTMFGEINLKHEAGLDKGIYVANVTIGKDVKEGKQRINYEATYANKFDEVSVLVDAQYSLNINTNLNQEYFKGNEILFSGSVFNLEQLPVSNAIITIEAYNKETRIFTIYAITNEDGEFLTNYFIKYADPEGDWDIIINAISEDKKLGEIDLPMKVEVPTGVDYYSVNFLSPLKDTLFRRGEIIPISVEVKEIENLIENASVIIYTPTNEIVNLEEGELGKYFGNYLVKTDDTLGNWFLKAEVSKESGVIKKVGGANLPIKIGFTDIKFNMLNPKKETIYANSRLKIKTKLTYPDSSLVKGANLNAFLSNGEIIPLLEKSDGVYEGDYFVNVKDTGTLSLEIKAEDASENIGILKENLFVRKRSILGNLLAYLKEGIIKYWWAVIAFLIIGAFIYKPTFEINWINKKLKKAKEEQIKIKSMQIYTEKKYYKEGSITKRNFIELMSKYEERLLKTKEEQKILEKSLSEKINQIKEKSKKVK